MAALIAAVMSHISGVINSCTTIATIDFYLPFINRRATEAQAVRFGRIVGVVVVLLGIVCAGSSSSTGKARLPVPAQRLRLFHARHRHHVPAGNPLEADHARGGLDGGHADHPADGALQFWLLPKMPFLNRTGIVFWVCMAVGVVVSLVTKPKPEAELTGLIWNARQPAAPRRAAGAVSRAAAAVSLVGPCDRRGAVLLRAISLTDGGWAGTTSGGEEGGKNVADRRPFGNNDACRQ